MIGWDADPQASPGRAATWRHGLGRLALMLGCLLGAILPALGVAGPSGPPTSITIAADGDFPPMLFRDASGELRGMQKDLWDLWSARTGIEVKYLASSWPVALARIDAGEADVIDLFAETEARRQRFVFGRHLTEMKGLLYFHESIAGIVDAKTARGFVVGVIQGNLCAEKLREAGVTDIRAYPGTQALVAAALRGEVRVFCAPEAAGNYFLNQAGQAGEFRHSLPVYVVQSGWAVRKGNEALRDRIADGFQRIDRAEQQRIVEKWMGSAVRRMDEPLYIRFSGYVIAGLLGVLVLMAIWLQTVRAVVARRTTALRDEQARLRDSEDRLRTILDGVEGCIYIKDSGYRYLFANRLACEIMGSSPQGVVGRDDADFFGSAQAAHMRSDDRRVIEDGERIVTEDVFHHPDGTLDKILKTVKLPLRHANGGIYALCGISIDVTAYKRLEMELEAHRQNLEQLVEARTRELADKSEQLRLSEERYAYALDAASDGLWDWDLQTGGSHVNPAYARMLGYAPDELPANPEGGWVALLHPDERDSVPARVRAELDSRGAHEVEFRMRCKDGSYKWILSRGKVVARGADGRPLRAAGTHVDLTARKQLELDLREAKEAAEAATRLKSNFLAVMSHEIRTPMNAIVGLTHLALKADPSARLQEFLVKIQASSHHLLALINDILDLSKIEADKLDLEHIDFDVDQLLAEVTELLAERAAEKGIELVVGQGDAVPARLKGDPLRLRQALLNYANNALKFTTQGEIEVRVDRVEAPDDAAVTLRFSVRDTGIGLDERQRQSLFRSFEQADQSITRKYGGTGLGLAITKRLAGLMGGMVGVESTLGVGSTFWFTARLEAGEVAGAGAVGPLPAARVLLADDNAAARRALGDMLGRQGLTVTAVGSGAAAIDEVRRTRGGPLAHAVVLLDWRMPGLDGIAAAREIDRLQPGAPPCLLLADVIDHRSAAAQAAASGIAGVLVKSVGVSPLRDALRRVLGAGGAVPAGPSAGPVEPDLAALSGARVLLVEDNEVNQEVARAILTDAGLEVDVAADGAAALDKVRAGAFDLVLMDMQMPVMDGIATTREIRRDPRFDGLPILAMTASAMSEDRARCFEAGMNDFIAKPIDHAELAARLVRWIRPRSAADGAPVADPAGAVAEELDTGRAGEVCRVLLEMFDEDDFACHQVLADNAPLLASLLGDAQRELTWAVQHCDFAAASEVLRQGLARRGIVAGR